jgi:DivIVA domain-containing protein
MTEGHGFELTPVDIRAQQFRKVMLGYGPDEVEDFKERLAQEVERHIREKAQLEDRLAGFREQLKAFREREKAMNDALIAAQALKAQMEEASQREADLVMREAGLEADKVVERARTAETAIQGNIETLQRQFAAYVAAFRRLLERQMAEVDAIAEYELEGTLPEAPEPASNNEPEDGDDD